MSISLRDSPVRAPRASVAGAWRLKELLAENRWTCSYLAHPAGNSAAGEFVLKLTRAGVTRESERELARGLLLREAAVSAEVNHPNLAATLAVERHRDEIRLVQPWSEGTTLSSLDESSLSLKLWIVRQLAQAVEALHRGDWLHGNISPEAVTVGPLGHATLGELGWSRQLNSDECDLAQTSFAGQIAYAAPEMFDDSGMLTAAADIYSLGVVLFELLTGRRLLAEYEGPELIAAKRLLRLPVVEMAGVPYEVCSLSARMLSRDPLRRLTAREVVQGLIAAEIACFGC